MHDKLLIHFLRPRNGGGEVLELLYPTEYAGVAIVTFELEEVADRILRRTHLLQLNSRSYHLEVSRDVETTSKTQEDYMTIRTMLHFQLFPEKNKVKMLVEKCGLKVCSEMDDAMEIEGEFPALAELKNELLHVLSDREKLQPSPRSTYSRTLAKQNSVPSEMAVHRRAQRENEKRPAPQGLVQYPVGSDYTGTLRLGRSPISNYSYESGVSHFSRHGESLSLSGPVQGYRVTAGLEQLTDYDANQEPLLLERQFANLPLTHSSKSNQCPKSNLFDYYSSSSTVHCKNPLSDESVLVSMEIPILERQGRVSNCIAVDGDTIKYIKAFKKEELDIVLKSPPVEMSSVDEGELSLVTLTSNRATSAEMENVLREFRNLLSVTELGLKTHDISFSGFIPEKKSLIIERSKELSNKYNSVAVRYNDRLHLIGPSQEVFLLKLTLIDDANLLRENREEHLAGTRGRRDSSCPASREKKTTASNYAIGDTRTYSNVHSRAGGHEIAGKIYESSTDMEAHKNKRLQRGNSLERAKYKEVQRAPEVGQGSDLSSLNTVERGRERKKNLIMKQLSKHDCETFKVKFKFSK
ncbi:hypothetical protein NDU88_003991 [Pleurodeles waltl]|uniref:RRM domain-containing protein n=2 Tax=Pleurodeles waltl TaxID=8319 RepID=A0AAV7M8K9_PLEWA|nr:hypothetical protein NDU88_003991 [Pleurodeles waltl]